MRGRSARARVGSSGPLLNSHRGRAVELLPEPRREAACVPLPVGGVERAAEDDRVPAVEAPDLAAGLGGGVMAGGAQRLGDDLGDLAVGPELGGIGDEDASGHGLPLAGIAVEVDALAVNLAPSTAHMAWRGHYDLESRPHRS